MPFCSMFFQENLKESADVFYAIGIPKSRYVVELLLFLWHFVDTSFF